MSIQIHIEGILYLYLYLYPISNIQYIHRLLNRINCFIFANKNKNIMI